MKEKDCLNNTGESVSESHNPTCSYAAVSEQDWEKQRNERYIGLNVFYMRKTVLRVSQEEFGYMVGMCKDTVSNIERGVYIPSVHSLVNISNCVHVAVDFFLYENKAEQIHAIPGDKNTRIALRSN